MKIMKVGEKMRNLKIGLLFILIFVNIGCVQTGLNRGTKVTPNQTQQRNKAPKTQNFGDYHALLIYVDDYKYLPKLETPKNDIEAVAKILKNRYGFKGVTIVPNPKNSDELVAILDKLTKKMSDNDNLLIYYAGHGDYIQKGDMGFWQLKDARKDSRVGWISVKQAINFTLSQMRAKHILVISDSCYSGAILRKGGAKLGVNRADMHYYKEIYQKKSRTALTSGALEPVSDGDPLNPNHSVFTNGFLYALQNNQKPIFTLEEKFSDIKRYVRIKSDMQTPLYSDIAKTGHDMGGDFIFVDRFTKAKLPVVVNKQNIPKTPIQTKRDPNITKAKKLIKIGDIAKKEGNTRESMKLYREACDLKNGVGCAKLGMSYDKQYNAQKAIVFYTKACMLGVQSVCKFIER